MKKHFLKAYKKAQLFVILEEHNNRKAQKVDIIHTQIAKTIEEVLGEKYLVITKGTTGKEEYIEGVYYKKRVDILIKNYKEEIIGGIAIKNPINSFLKNKNNYFENMLGETANIRAKNYLYFQILIFPHKIPDWKNSNKEKHLTKFHEIKKYLSSYEKLNNNHKNYYLHIPSKILILIIKNNLIDNFNGYTKKQYFSFFKENKDKISFTFEDIKKSDQKQNLLINEYEKYINDICNTIKNYQEI